MIPLSPRYVWNRSSSRVSASSQSESRAFYPVRRNTSISICTQISESVVWNIRPSR